MKLKQLLGVCLLLLLVGSPSYAGSKMKSLTKWTNWGKTVKTRKHPRGTLPKVVVPGKAAITNNSGITANSTALQATSDHLDAAVNRSVLQAQAGIATEQKLTSIQVDKIVNSPAAEAYLNLLVWQFGFIRPTQKEAQLLANAWAAETNGQIVYKSPTELARKLDNFYQGQTTMRLSTDDRYVKLYTLPADGMVILTQGKPMVLNSANHIVVYDVESETGEIVANTPEIYAQFPTLAQTL